MAPTASGTALLKIGLASTAVAAVGCLFVAVVTALGAAEAGWARIMALAISSGALVFATFALALEVLDRTPSTSLGPAPASGPRSDAHSLAAAPVSPAIRPTSRPRLQRVK